MSWSIQVIGKPEKLVDYLESYSDELSDLSKEEFEAAKPNLIGIVKQNFGNDGQFIKLIANGHGFVNNQKEQRQLSVNIESLYGEFVG